MIKDILVLDEYGNDLGIVGNDMPDGENAIINLIEVTMDEMPNGKGQVLDVLYIQDMKYGIVIPKHIAKELSKLLALDLSPEDLESEKRCEGADIDGDIINGEYHNLSEEMEQAYKNNELHNEKMFRARANEIEEKLSQNKKQATAEIQRIDDLKKELGGNK